MNFDFLFSRKLLSKIVILTVLVSIFSSCASTTKYYWGHYEDILYTQYQEPGKATPEFQIEKMRADIQRGRGKNLPMPPGFYAHLGYQYLLTGKAVEARNCFNIEKRAFPESAVLMDRFIAKLK